MTRTFDKISLERLDKAHPLLQQLMLEARKSFEFIILQSQRGEAEQELAVKRGHSKVHFGKSAHNWSPAIALDVAPLPLNWKNTRPFVELSRVILPLANGLKIPIRWGADWDMDGSTADERFVDMPHYELHPWRSFAKKAKLFRG